MPRRLTAYIGWLVAVCAVAFAVTGLVIPVNSRIRTGVFSDPSIDTLAGVVFWTLATILASALPVKMARGSVVNTSIAPLVVVMALGGPTAAGLVALIGTTELRELRGRVPWYGSLANHAGLALPAIVGGIICIAGGSGSETAVTSFAATLLGAAAFFTLNVAFASVTVALRTGQSAIRVLLSDPTEYVQEFVALVPLAWLMSQVYVRDGVGWWAVTLVVLPVYVIGLSMQRFVDMRDMFTQTVRSLANAVDARDKFTAGHSEAVQQIAVDIGRVMRVSDAELEALEWGGLLHDIGKIGIRDDVLLKQDRLTKEERALMNAHPVIGANIIAPVTKLAPELPIIRHHHEWFNGSGYPDRLLGDEIPRLARILHVADAFEAMTNQRPYRMTPLSTEQAVAELRKYAGIQFDPLVVDAFVKTSWAEGVPDPGRFVAPKPVPLIAQAASRMAQSVARDVMVEPHGGGPCGTGSGGPPGAASADAS